MYFTIHRALDHRYVRKGELRQDTTSNLLSEEDGKEMQNKKLEHIHLDCHILALNSLEYSIFAQSLYLTNYRIMNKIHFSLNKKERLQYIYLLKILENLCPEKSSEYANYRKALEQGFTLHYEDMMIEISEEELSVEGCKEVLAILEMYRGIIYSYRALKEDIETISLKDEDVKFPGFDGNNETEQMLYVEYLIEDLGRYSEIQDLSNNYYNSHREMLGKYRSMLKTWDSYRSLLKDRHSMKEKEIRKLLES